MMTAIIGGCIDRMKYKTYNFKLNGTATYNVSVRAYDEESAWDAFYDEKFMGITRESDVEFDMELAEMEDDDNDSF